MKKEQFFEHVQDAIEALHKIIPEYPGQTDFLEICLTALEWDLQNEANRIDFHNFVNARRNHAHQAD